MVGPVPGDGGDERGSTRQPRSMVIVAHQDDDLYFLDPLLTSQLRHSEEHLTVCLSAGEADGRNAPGGRAHAGAPVNFEAFAAARFNGLRSAYADMLLGDRDAKWHRTGRLLNGVEIEVSTLPDMPRVRLATFNIWCAPPPGSPAGAGSLQALWTGDATCSPTMVPWGSPVSGTYTYSRSSLVEALLVLLREFAPTLLWTMDPDPDLQVHDRDNPRHADTGDYSDHAAHTAVALFAHEAAQRWFAEGGGNFTSIEAFRGYYVRRWPSNLSPAARALKQRHKDVYGWADGRPSTDPAGLGDRKVGGDPIGAGNASGTTLRYPGSGSWGGPDPTGRLSAFAVRGGRVVHWRAGATDFPAPAVAMSGAQLLPHVASVALPAGGWRLFTVRQELAPDPERHVRDILTSVLDPSRDPADVVWESLGNPAGERASARHRNLGVPHAVPLPGGAILLLSRNADKGLSGRWYDGSSWGAWRNLGGKDIQDGLSAVALDDGTVEVVAAGRAGVARWLISVPDLTSEHTVLPMEPPAGPPVLVALPEGERMVFHRRRDSASVLSYRTCAGGAEWDATSATDLGGNGGPGPLAARFDPGHGAVLLAVRDDRSATSVTFVDPVVPGASGWFTEGTPIHGDHVVAVGTAGGPLVLAVSTSGTLLNLRPDRSAQSLKLVKEVP